MRSTFILILFCLGIGFSGSASTGKYKVLVLSGKNNHNWKETTPYLKKMYEKSGLFEVLVSNKPETLADGDFEGVDVVVSNWSSFPDKEYRWPVTAENALLNFIENGGGFVSLHAATTAFYEWPEFKEISTGAWIKGTSHGKQCEAKVRVENNKHPITKGIHNFSTFDELWMNAELNSDFEVLASAENENTVREGLQKQPVLSVRDYGKGRVVHNALGHDVRMMRNIGFETLMLRATEWAASGKVKQEIPQELQANASGKAKYTWSHSDSTLALLNRKQMVWKYNFREQHQKPHFYPVFVGRNNITCVAPDDHPWHVGQWFSWKFINGVNYWEFVNKKEYRSEGVTEVKDIRFLSEPDFSATIELDILYHPAKGKNVLEETRTIFVSQPSDDGSISMDYRFEFTALAETVELDRTPIEGEANGKKWGGYGGLSLRFNQSFMNPLTIFSGDNDKIHGENGNWLCMEFTGIDGQRTGTQVMIADGSQPEQTAWYLENSEKFPFYYFSPAPLFRQAIQLKKGEKLILDYRVNHYAKPKTKDDLEKEYKNYINQ